VLRAACCAEREPSTHATRKHAALPSHEFSSSTCPGHGRGRIHWLTLVERLLADGKAVVVIDDCSTGRLENLKRVAAHPRLRIIQGKSSQCPELGGCGGFRRIHLSSGGGGGRGIGGEFFRSMCCKRICTRRKRFSMRRRCGVFLLLFTSTSEVYGKSQKPAFGEEDDLLIGPPHVGRWSYACSKLMDEFLRWHTRANVRCPLVIARLFNTVGPRQTGRYGMVLPRFIAAARSGQPLKVHDDGRQTRCFCYVLDTVEARCGCRILPPRAAGCLTWARRRKSASQNLPVRSRKCWDRIRRLNLCPIKRPFRPASRTCAAGKPVVEKLYKTTGFRPATPLRQIIKLAASGHVIPIHDDHRYKAG